MDYQPFVWAKVNSMLLRGSRPYRLFDTTVDSYGVRDEENFSSPKHWLIGLLLGLAMLLWYLVHRVSVKVPPRVLYFRKSDRPA